MCSCAEAIEIDPGHDRPFQKPAFFGNLAFSKSRVRAAFGNLFIQELPMLFCRLVLIGALQSPGPPVMVNGLGIAHRDPIFTPADFTETGVSLEYAPSANGRFANSSARAICR